MQVAVSGGLGVTEVKYITGMEYLFVQLGNRICDLV